MKFSIICCDPPYDFSDGLARMKVKTKRSAQSNYDTMTIEDIKALSIPEVVDPSGCCLAIWVPSSLLQDGLDIMSAWGFQLKTTYIWVKQKKSPLERLTKLTKALIKQAVDLKSATKEVSQIQEKFDLNDTMAIGMGRTFRAAHELALIGINNNGIYKQLANKSQRSVSFAINEGHSIKPEHLQNSLDLMFPEARKLELFARRQRPDWMCIGNQAPATLGEDIRVSLAKLMEEDEKQCFNF